MIHLEKFDKTDYDRLIRWIDSEEAMVQFSGPMFSYPITEAQLQAYCNAANRLAFRVVETSTNTVIGHAEINNIDIKNSNARICRILIGDTNKRNKGYGKAIIRQLVSIGFEQLKLHRLDLGVFDFNLSAIKCYQQCGFTIEGLLKDNYKVGDVYWSTYNMSIINHNQ